MRFYCLPLSLLLVFLFLFKLITAQPSDKWDCADEKLLKLQMQSVPSFLQKERQNNLVVKEYIRAFYNKNEAQVGPKQDSAANGSKYVIPVVVHIVYPDGEAYGTGTNISYAQIRSQVEALNAAFAKNYPSYNGQQHPSYAANTGISFCLARVAQDGSPWFKGPGGDEFGVRRYPDKTNAYNHFINESSANTLKNLTDPDGAKFPFQKYLNIWLVQTIDGGNNVMGYAPRPIMTGYPLDGVVMRADIFGDNTAGGNYLSNYFGLLQGKVLAHEVGHYLNLYHIFQGGCAGANAAGSDNDACDLNGDLICDIEPATTQNIFCSSGIPNTCTANYNAGTTTLDMIEDYMSYADDDCMNTFTADQVKRMWATLHLQRPTLWQADNLVATGILGNDGCVPPFLNANIETNKAVFCMDGPVQFSNPTGGNTATTYQWEFPGSNTATASTRAVTVTYNAPGNYKAFLKVSDGINTRSDSLLFTMLECKLDSTMLHMSNWYFGNFGSIDFSSGAPIQTDIALVKNTMQGEPAYPGQLSFVQGTVSLSDSLGHLLFYSNGVSVWNKEHKKISTGPIFGASDINASTGICYIPYPGKPNKYFITGVYPNFDETPSGVRFVLVDLDNNTVSPYTEFSSPSLPKRFSQYLTVLPHCDGSSFWIVAKGAGWTYDNRYFSMLVNSSGIDAAQLPIISDGFKQPGFGGSGYQLKANRRGDKMIITSPNVDFAGALYDFDNRTGKLTNERGIPNVLGYNNIQTGVCFSPNGEYFYLMRSSDLQLNGKPYWLFQYRVSDFGYNIIEAPGFYFCSPFQPGPDNQIYITTQDHYFARLSNPDKWGGATVNGSFINMRDLNINVNTGVSMPAFIDARRPVPTNPDFLSTLTGCNTYQFSALCFNDYTATWDFGDGTPSQTGNLTEHRYMQAGSFTVRMTLSKASVVFGTANKTLTIFSQNSSIDGPAYVCTGSSFATQYFAPIEDGATYKWAAVNGSISGADNMAYAGIVWNRHAQHGTVQLAFSKDKCQINISKNVSIVKGPSFKWDLQDSICLYDSSIALDALPADGRFEGAGIQNNRFYPAVAGLGYHPITYWYADEITCLGQIQKVIKVSNCRIPPELGTDCGEVLKQVQVMESSDKHRLLLKSIYVLGHGQVFNTLGQKVAEGDLKNNTLSLPMLPKGLYVVRIFCSGQKYSRSLKFLL